MTKRVSQKDVNIVGSMVYAMWSLYVAKTFWGKLREKQNKNTTCE